VKGGAGAERALDQVPRKSSAAAGWLVSALVLVAAFPGWLWLTRGPAVNEAQSAFRVALLIVGIGGLGVVAAVRWRTRR